MSQNGSRPGQGATYSVSEFCEGSNLQHSTAQAASLPRGTPPELVAAIEAAAVNAFREHGATAFAAPREAAAVHEAGHAVMMTHEGLTVESVRIFSRESSWSGWCAEKNSKEWTTSPTTSAENDLSRARIVIAGLAAEALTGLDRAGSSLDEVGLSQLIGGINAGVKLADPALTDAALAAFQEKLWHDRVWGVTLSTLRANHQPFIRLAELLNQDEVVAGGKLRKALAQVSRRIAQ